jgi:Sof1-like domain
LQIKPRERLAIDYSNSLKEKYAPHPQIKRIAKHRQVPKHIYNASKEHRVIHQKLKRKYVFFSNFAASNIYILIFCSGSTTGKFTPNQDLWSSSLRRRKLLFRSTNKYITIFISTNIFYQFITYNMRGTIEIPCKETFAVSIATQ